MEHKLVGPLFSEDRLDWLPGKGLLGIHQRIAWWGGGPSKYLVSFGTLMACLIHASTHWVTGP